MSECVVVLLCCAIVFFHWVKQFLCGIPIINTWLYWLSAHLVFIRHGLFVEEAQCPAWYFSQGGAEICPCLSMFPLHWIYSPLQFEGLKRYWGFMCNINDAMFIMFDISLTGDLLSTKYDRNCIRSMVRGRDRGVCTWEMVKRERETGWGQIIWHILSLPR